MGISALTVAILAAFAADGCFGQIPYSGKCPFVPTKPDFEASLYTGRWFEQEKIPAASEANLVCISAEYYLMPNGWVKVINHGFNVVQGRYISITGNAVQNPKRRGQLGVRFFQGQSRKPYYVLDTDYNTYSVVFSCLESVRKGYPTSQRYLWILTRQPWGISPQLRHKLLAMVESFGIINTSYLTRTPQKKC